MKEALFYEKLANKKVHCHLCPRNCIILDGKTGFCRVRQNRNGILYSLVYDKLCSMNIDPIEKKPLFHFYPGSLCLSVSTVGCNLNCSFCQNWEISHPDQIFGDDISPERIVETAKENNVPGIAYTYTEPTIFFELAYDTMKLARKEGLYNVWVSNGYINPEPAKKAAKYMDAINVDLKGDVKFYQKLCSVPNEEPMKKALKIYKEEGVWIEITNLIIPGFNDKQEQIKKLVSWVKNNLGTDTPLHFSRFYPQYKMLDVKPTPVETLEKAVDIAKKAGMHYAYLGNVLDNRWESTYCWKCGDVLIKRSGYDILSFKGKCKKCNIKISGVVKGG
jgi:pyruvate formate lyase activating enzyme